MTAGLRFLSVVASSPVMAEEPETANTRSDYAIVLAALSCALICAVGLAVVARCACLRRRRLSSATSPSHSVEQVLPLPPPPGLKKKSLLLLPMATYSSVMDGKCKISDCAICLTEFTDGELLRVLPQCGHVFHLTCIDKWLACHSSCPSCREMVLVNSRYGRLQPETDQKTIGLKTGREYAFGFLP